MGNKLIIGMTGPFGSGCSYLANTFLKPLGYRYLSLSDILREETKTNEEIQRTELQDCGNKLREEKGPDILAQRAIAKIDQENDEKWVIDSIRNTHEIEAFKKKYGTFYLIAAWADQEIRWERVKHKYSNNRTLFDIDDARDSRERFENGQQVSLCYQMADIIIINNNAVLFEGTDQYLTLQKMVERYVKLIEGRESFCPNEQETLMSMAYANSMRSSCTQRKVGALIIDDYGNVFSSGYNEVPSSERPCKNTYGMCYRKYLRNNFTEELSEIVNDAELLESIKEKVKRQFKMLDYCRALHAEENAIINMARLGGSKNLSNATLYTTTYPCNLCANKIAQVGIRQIVYFEPYPQKEAKKTLQLHGVKQTPFEGITYNGYFRFMEVLR